MRQCEQFFRHWWSSLKKVQRSDAAAAVNSVIFPASTPRLLQLCPCAAYRSRPRTSSNEALPLPIIYDDQGITSFPPSCLLPLHMVRQPHNKLAMYNLSSPHIPAHGLTLHVFLAISTSNAGKVVIAPWCCMKALDQSIPLEAWLAWTPKDGNLVVITSIALKFSAVRYDDLSAQQSVLLSACSAKHAGFTAKMFSRGEDAAAASCSAAQQDMMKHPGTVQN